MLDFWWSSTKSTKRVLEGESKWLQDDVKSQLWSSLFLMGRLKPSLGYSVLTHIRDHASEMPFCIQTSCAFLVLMCRSNNEVVCVLLVDHLSGLAALAPSRLFILLIYSVMDESGPSNGPRPDPRGKCNSIQGCQLRKKILAKYLIYDPHNYILDGVCPVIDGFNLFATTPTMSGKTGFFTLLMLVVWEIPRSLQPFKGQIGVSISLHLGSWISFVGCFHFCPHTSMECLKTETDVYWKWIPEEYLYVHEEPAKVECLDNKRLCWMV